MAKTKDQPIKLAQWTEKIDFAASKDPLGLAERVSGRLIDQLLFGITTVGNRARYYSYSLWAIHDVMEREKPVNNKEMREGIYWRDSAFMATCLIHHKDEGYDLNGAIGKDKGSAYLKNASKYIDLDAIKHIKSNPEGGFGQAYKGSLKKLDLFHESYFDESQQYIIYEVSNQPAVQKMLKSFEDNIRNTIFYKEYACKRIPVPIPVLEEFGQKICICLLPKDDAPERDILRDILFERVKGYQPLDSFRPDSLRLLLYCAKLCSSLNVSFTHKQFRTMISFGEYADHNNKYKPIHFNKGVDEIVNRWRIFFVHHYLSIALEGIFVVLLNLLSESIDAGLTLSQIIERLETDGLVDAVKDITGSTVINFDKTSIGEILRESLGDGLTRSRSPWTILNAENSMSEENLIDDLNRLIKSSHVKAVSRCLVILMVLLERCSRLEEENKYWGWALSVSKGDYAKSISAPILYLYLKQHKINWREFTLKEFIEIIIRRFVIEQHELMVPEKKGGVSWLTYDDGHLFFQNSFDGPSPGNSRFGSARQIICDLGLMKLDDNDVPQLLPYSDVILSEILEGNK